MQWPMTGLNACCMHLLLILPTLHMGGGGHVSTFGYSFLVGRLGHRVWSSSAEKLDNIRATSTWALFSLSSIYVLHSIRYQKSVDPIVCIQFIIYYIIWTLTFWEAICMCAPMHKKVSKWYSPYSVSHCLISACHRWALFKCFKFVKSKCLMNVS